MTFLLTFLLSVNIVAVAYAPNVYSVLALPMLLFAVVWTLRNRLTHSAQ